MEIEDLKQLLGADLPLGAEWAPLSGGRTNRVWRVTSRTGDFVCKLYRGGRDNPLFPNLPETEFACLQGLSGKEIAPDPVAFRQVPDGRIVIYAFAPGRPWSGDVLPVARLLSQVHALRPGITLRHLPMGFGAVLDKGQQILNGLTGAQAETLRSLIPKGGDVPDIAPCFLHGDVVPGNLLITPAGLRLIDWQCPGLGDPVDDLACFLSPAMQTVYGQGPLDVDQMDRFLAAYGQPGMAERYRVLAPAYHFRMAAYCLWRCAQGDADYKAAFTAERAALENGQ